MEKLIFIYLNQSTFVQKDFDFLSEHYDVHKIHFKASKNPFQLLLGIIRQFFLLMFYLPGSKIIYCWFADYHSLLPVLLARAFHRKSFVVLGGYDVTGVQKIKYGIHYANRFRRFANRLTITFAHVLLPVHDSLVDNRNEYHRGESKHVGIYSITHQIKGQIRPMPTGYNPDQWKVLNVKLKRQGVVSVAGVSNERTWILKGGDLLLYLAKNFPDIDFHFYGVNEIMQKKIKGGNVPNNFYLHGYINNQDLVAVYAKFKYYVQLSLSEGLPNSLCEAMLCECIPIGSMVNGIPDAIGDTGYILKSMDHKAAINLFESAFNMTNKGGAEARERIIMRFNEELRWSSLIDLLKI